MKASSIIYAYLIRPAMYGLVGYFVGYLILKYVPGGQQVDPMMGFWSAFAAIIAFGRINSKTTFITFRDESIGFKIDFPSKPETSTNAVGNGVLVQRTEVGDFQVVSTKFTNDTINMASDDLSMANGDASSLNGKLINQEVYNNGKATGNRYVISFNKDGKNIDEYMWIVRNNLTIHQIVLFVFHDDTDRENKLNAFYGSFELIGNH